jgi:hypothetical protein
MERLETAEQASIPPSSRSGSCPAVAITGAGGLRAFGRAIRAAGRRHPRALPTAAANFGVFPPAILEVIADHSGRDGAAEPDPRLVNGIAAVAAFALGWALVTSPGAGPAAGGRWNPATAAPPGRPCSSSGHTERTDPAGVPSGLPGHDGCLLRRRPRTNHSASTSCWLTPTVPETPAASTPG